VENWRNQKKIGNSSYWTSFGSNNDGGNRQITKENNYYKKRIIIVDSSLNLINGVFVFKNCFVKGQ
jgi:hypothetical protein